MIRNLLLAVVMTAAAGARPAASQARPVADEGAALEAFMDSVIGIELREYGVPGMVVTVVRGGRVVLAKGYGFADLRTRRPMSAEGTVVRVGSVSKPVTALAALQLVQAGRIDLDARVSAYLPGVLHGRWADRVRVRDLFTHTAGLDVRLNGTAAASADRQLPLERYLARDLPPVVHRPGRVPRYSNHGYVLLGRLVEVASGETFDAYVRRSVFAPLGMRSSAFRLEGALARAAAAGYEPSRGGPVRAAVVHPHISPAAGLNTTAADMGRLMAAMLDSGRIPGAARPLYSPRTAALLLGRQTGMDPRMPGWTLGMFETVRGGVRGVGHSGGIRGFMSGMYLWPDRRTALFVSDNGYDGGAVQAVLQAFADRYVAGPRAAPPAPAPGADGRAARVAGTYRLEGMAVRSLERAGGLRRGHLRVGAHPDGSIYVFGTRFVEAGPGLYRAAEGDEAVAFRMDAAGRPAWLLTSDPIGGNRAWERVAWYQAPPFHQALALLCLFGFLSLPWIRPRARGGVLKRAPAAAAVDRARTHRRAVAVAYLGFAAALVLAFRATRATGLLTGVPLAVRAALAAGVAATLLAAALPATGWRLHRAGAPRAELALHAGTTMVALVFALLLWWWNLLGFRFG